MDLWTAATTDLDAERHDRLVTTARLACVGDFAFAAQAATREGFEDRLALIEASVDEKLAALDALAVKAELLAGWREDFTVTAGSFEDGIERIMAETDPAVLRKMLDQNANLRGLGVEFSTMDKLDAQDDAARARLKELTGSKVAAADDTPVTCSSCGAHLKTSEFGQFGGKCMSCYAGKKTSGWFDNGPADSNDGISYGDDDRYDYGRMDEEPRSRPSFEPFYVKYTCPTCGEQNVEWIDWAGTELRCSHGHRIYNNAEPISNEEARRLNRSTANDRKTPLVPGKTASADTAPYDADWAHDDAMAAEADEVQEQGSLSTPSDSSVLSALAAETDLGTLAELIEQSAGHPRYARLVAMAQRRIAELSIVAEFPPKKKDDDDGSEKPEEKGEKAEDSKGDSAPPSKDDAPPADPNDPNAAPAAVAPAQPAAPAAPPHGNPQPSQTNAPNPAAPGAPAPAVDPGSDPAQMEVGATSKMTYTMTEGTTGSVEVVFIREDQGVYYFNGPSGEFGVTNTSGQWQDAEGNTFTFASGDGSSNDDDPMKAKEADPGVDAQAVDEEKPEEKDDSGDDDKKPFPPKKAAYWDEPWRVTPLNDNQWAVMRGDGQEYVGNADGTDIQRFTTKAQAQRHADSLNAGS